MNDKEVKSAKILHKYFVMERRVNVLAMWLGELLPEKSSVLDIGAGSGQIASKLLSKRPDLDITCIDVMQRTDSEISVYQFDGENIGYDDDAFDYSIFVDVLHHTTKQQELLREANRVSKKGVIIKDHIYNSSFDYRLLSFMDYVGNRPYAVELVYDYLSLEQWKEMFKQENLKIKSINTNLGLYPFPLNYIFDRQLHILVKLNNQYVCDGRKD